MSSTDLIPLNTNTQLTVSKAPFAQCHMCPLRSQPFVPTEDKAAPKYTIVGESPGENEAREGVAFVGASGKFLWHVLNRVGITRDDCNVTNAVLCYPGKGEAKEGVIDQARMCCKPRLEVELARWERPTLLLGKYARLSVLGEPAKGESNTTLNSRWVDTRYLSTIHPAALFRNPNDAKDFLTAIRKFGTVPQGPYPKPTYEVVTDLRQIESLLTAGEIAFDIETSQTSILWDEVLLVTLTDSRNPNHAYIVPGQHRGAPDDVLSATMDDPFWKELWREDRPCKFVGHNSKFDMRFLKWQYKWNVRTDFDTMLAHYTLDERAGTKDLKGIAARLLDEPDWEVGLHQYLTSRNDDYGKIPWDVLCQYAAYDSTRTRYLRPILEQMLHENGQYDWPFMRVLMPMNAMFLDSEMWGVHVNQERLQILQIELATELTKLTAEVVEATGGRVTNLNSPVQLAKFIYDDLKMPLQTGKHVNPRGTDKMAMQNLRSGAHPVAIDTIARARKPQKILSAYVNNVWPLIDMNGNVHQDTKFGTEIARVSVVDPAFQTIPRADDREEGQYGVRVKSCYEARPGYRFGACDYKQAELCAAAAVSGDPFLVGTYRAGGDIHAELATKLFGPDFTKGQKTLEKMMLFGLIYGGNEYSFAQTAGIPLDIAIPMAREMLKVIAGFTEFREEIAQQMYRQGYVVSRMGRRRRFPYVNDVNKEEARKAALHSVIASGAADCTNIAAFRAAPKIAKLDGHVLFLVHDAIIFEFPNKLEIEREVGSIIRNEMVATGQEFFPEVPWRAELETGFDWGHLHG